MRLPLAIALIAGLAAPAWGQTATVSPRADQTALVLYRFRPLDTSRALEDMRNGDGRLRDQGLAMIVETRTVDVPVGEGIIRFEGLASGIVPETAVLEGLPGGVLEQNAAFEVLTPGGLLQHSVGDVIQVVRVDRQTGAETTVPAIVRSGAQGTVLEIDGRLEPLSCQGLTQRLIFDRIPEELGETPTLSVRTRSATAGRHVVRLAYLTFGLSWSADYVARLAPDGRTMDIDGWITLMNQGGNSYADVPVQMVAGNLNLDYETDAVEPVAAIETPDCWPMDTTTSGAAPLRLQVRAPVADYLATLPALSNSTLETQIDEVVVTGSRIIAPLAELGDYKIYSLPERTDLNARQAKQIRFFDQSGVSFARTYSARLDMDEVDPPSIHLLLRLNNTAEDGLGVPMPGGGISLMEAQDGVTLLTGQASFLDRGEGTPLDLAFGEAMDIGIDYELRDGREWTRGEVSTRRVTVEATLTNDKAWPVEIEIASGWSHRPGFRVVRESQRSLINASGTRVWRVQMPANGTRTLEFTVQAEDY